MTFLTDRYGITSSNNSTDEPLGATGTSENVENYGNVTVNIKSDTNSI